MQRNVIAFVLLFALLAVNVFQLIGVSRSNAAIERHLRQLVTVAEGREAAAREYQQLTARVWSAASAGASHGGAHADYPPAGLAAAGQVAARQERDPARPPALEDEKRPPRPEAVTAFQEAGKMVDQGLARGAWTSDDVHQMKRWLPEMDNKDRDEVIHRLLQAVNDGKVRPPAGGMLF